MAKSSKSEVPKGTRIVKDEEGYIPERELTDSQFESQMKPLLRILEKASKDNVNVFEANSHYKNGDYVFDYEPASNILNAVKKAYDNLMKYPDVEYQGGINDEFMHGKNSVFYKTMKSLYYSGGGLSSTYGIYTSETLGLDTFALTRAGLINSLYSYIYKSYGGKPNLNLKDYIPKKKSK